LPVHWSLSLVRRLELLGPSQDKPPSGCLSLAIGSSERVIALALWLHATSLLAPFIGAWITLKFAANWQRRDSKGHGGDGKKRVKPSRDRRPAQRSWYKKLPGWAEVILDTLLEWIFKALEWASKVLIWLLAILGMKPAILEYEALPSEVWVARNSLLALVGSVISFGPTILVAYCFDQSGLLYFTDLSKH